MKFVLIFVVLFAGHQTFAEETSKSSEIALCEKSMSDKSRDSLVSALTHIDSFEYVRGALKEYAKAGYSSCASGVMLTKNIYQYYKYFLNIETRDQGGELVSVLPIYFQTASIQAHHNAGAKPWIVVDRESAKVYFEDKVVSTFKAQTTVSGDNLYEVAKAQPWWKQVQEDSFAIMRLETSGAAKYYLATWVYSISTGSLFTQEFGSKAVPFKVENGVVEVGEMQSGYSLLIDYLEKALVETAAAAPANVDTWDAYVLELIK